MNKEIFKNTFAPRVVQEYLTLNQIKEGVKYSNIDFKNLPSEIKRAIEEDRKLEKI